MSAPIDTDQLEQRARALLDDRIAAVRELAALRQTTIERRDALAEAEKADAAGYAAALRAGWTDEELKKVGFDAPGKRPAGRPRKAKKAPPAAAPDIPGPTAAGNDA